MYGARHPAQVTCPPPTACVPYFQTLSTSTCQRWPLSNPPPPPLAPLSRRSKAAGRRISRRGARRHYQQPTRPRRESESKGCVKRQRNISDISPLLPRLACFARLLCIVSCCGRDQWRRRPASVVPLKRAGGFCLLPPAPLVSFDSCCLHPAEPSTALLVPRVRWKLHVCCVLLC